MKRHLSLLASAAMALVFVFTACNSSDDSDNSVKVTSVSLNKTTLTLNVGQTETLTYTIEPSNATNKNVTWTSSAPTVATVSDTGLVIAASAGSATITVATRDGNKTDTCNVTVSAAPALTIQARPLAAGGGGHTLGIRNGQLWAWGYGGDGQLGNGEYGSAATRETPERIGIYTDWVAVAAGSYHSLGIRSDGSLWAWGFNGNSSNPDGVLGIGTGGPDTRVNVPTRVGSDTWATVSAISYRAVGIKSDGSLWAWGRSNNVRFADGTDTNRNAPGRIGADNDWMTVSCGAEHTLLLKSDGSLWAWGTGRDGQLGNGGLFNDTANLDVPTHIGTDNWKAISAGSYHSVGIKSNGSLWSWGFNGNPSTTGGMLGIGTEGQDTRVNTPTRIGDENDWNYLSLGAAYHTFAMKTNGQLWGWGRNGDDGLLGENRIENRLAPVRIGNDNWMVVSVSSYHSLGMKSDGTIWAWGQNSQGQLGDGSNTERSLSPVQVNF
jgi:alpha-tubulin suppressor-like RCC1 family protein